jgi:hypothetical protein
MAKKTQFDGIIVKREISPEGYVYCYDKNDRTCWGSPDPERIVLMHDLRKYAAGLHIGQLGWTVPGTSDGYKWTDVQFDCGPRLPILVYSLERVPPERADDISARLLAANRNTRFDADPNVAQRCHQEWVRKSYETFVATDQMVESGTGDQEVYAYTFQSLQELARLKKESRYPVKVGYTADKNAGAIERIRSQIFEAAAFPERPSVLLVHRTWNGLGLEAAIHKRLRDQGQHIVTGPGAEWFKTNYVEIRAICNELQDSVEKPKLKPLSGASTTLQESLGDNAHMEVVQYPGSAAVGLRIVYNGDSGKDPAVQPDDKPCG